MSKLLFTILYEDIKQVHSSIENRAEMQGFRQSVLKSFSPMVKTAFDTRRVNQETEFNPRRNLQYYHRSDPFMTKDASETIKTLFKLKVAVDAIKEDFAHDPDWMDSYCRTLHAALDRTLRVEQKDMDFSQPQLDYIKELLYLRYRLKDEDIIRLNEKELRGIILARDEKLAYKQVYSHYNSGMVKTNEIQRPNYEPLMNNATIVREKDPLIEKLFGDVKASKENKEVERSITITINDKIKEDTLQKKVSTKKKAVKKEGKEGNGQ